VTSVTLTLIAQEGEPSHALYAKERAELLASLKRRAEKLHGALSELPGVSCNPPEGALYAMPRIRLPPGAIQVAPRPSPSRQAARGIVGGAGGVGRIACCGYALLVLVLARLAAAWTVVMPCGRAGGHASARRWGRPARGQRRDRGRTCLLCRVIARWPGRVMGRLS